MFTWPWWIFSIIAAVLWGLHFNLVVKVANVLPRDIYSPLTLFFITSVSILLILPVVYQKVLANLVTLWHASDDIKISVVVLVFTALIAASLLFIAMQLSPNPTVAALLDITYPVFIAIIAWLLYRENHLDWSVLVGGGLIFSGAMLIVWKHG
ncbi:MAG: EamA family transporter [Gammaproteobacteria bacterium]|nr:EamA family transporter [Gammaproteobacteria bacterium]